MKVRIARFSVSIWCNVHTHKSTLACKRLIISYLMSWLVQSTEIWDTRAYNLYYKGILNCFCSCSLIYFPVNNWLIIIRPLSSPYFGSGHILNGKPGPVCNTVNLRNPRRD